MGLLNTNPVFDVQWSYVQQIAYGTFFYACFWLCVASPAGAQEVERDGITVGFPPGTEIHDIDIDGHRSTVQAPNGDVVVRVQRGERFRDATDGRRTATTVCGRPAQRVIIEVPRFSATPSPPLDSHGRHLRRIDEPARIEIALELVHRGIPFRITWSVIASRRAIHRAAERAFFRSIRCTP